MTSLMVMMTMMTVTSIRTRYLLVIDGTTFMENKGTYIFEQNICSVR